MYALGIDIGTTFTAAATWRNGHAETVSLGSRASVIPSVVLLRDDDTFLTGEGANRRGLTEPHRVAREFKRRLGDTTPILLGGVPYSAEQLTARLLRSVVDDVCAREGGGPTTITISHPANWGPYKTDLLQQGVRLAGLAQPVSYTTEPEAAAVFYAQSQRVEPGAVVAVYDLGGGTFDAAVLRKTTTAFQILGRPEGIERLGGIDIDAAVFNHVARALGDKLSKLDEEDPAVVAAVARLRDECVEAKEALSADTDVTIPVLLPSLTTEVRLTRAELEAMVRPVLHDTIEALRRALRSANVTAEDLHSVLLVGGSSRMPLVAQLVGAELGRPVTVDAHPKHAVALGAAWLASGATADDTLVPVGPAIGTAPPPAIAPPATPRAATPRPASGSARIPIVVPGPTGPSAATAPTPPTATSALTPPARPSELTVVRESGPAGLPQPPPVFTAATANSSRRRVLVASLVALFVLFAAGMVVLSLSDRPSDSPAAAGQTSAATVPPDELCSDAITRNPQWVCITRARLNSDGLSVEFDIKDGGTPFSQRGFHIHFYGASADGSVPSDTLMGSQAAQPGSWYTETKSPSAYGVGTEEYDTIKGHPKICARIAHGAHDLVYDNSGRNTYKSGNCWPLNATA